MTYYAFWLKYRLLLQDGEPLLAESLETARSIVVSYIDCECVSNYCGLTDDQILSGSPETTTIELPRIIEVQELPDGSILWKGRTIYQKSN